MEISSFNNLEHPEVLKEFIEASQGNMFYLSPEQLEYLNELDPVLQENIPVDEKLSFIKERMNELMDKNIFESIKDKLKELLTNKHLIHSAIHRLPELLSQLKIKK